MNYWTALLLVLLAVLQSTVVPRIQIFGVHPDLMLVVVVSWSLLRGSEEGMLWALVGGLALDLLSGAQIGVSTLPLLIVGFLAGLWQRGVFRLDLAIPILVVPLATLIQQCAMVALLKMLGWPALWNATFRYAILPSVWVNTLTAPLVYVLIRWIHRHTRDEGIAMAIWQS
jgi:rod shape-determining protein MreD